MEYIKTSINQVDVNIVRTNKFKTIKMHVSFISNLDENTIATRALLPFVMKSASKKYPTKKSISMKLEDMYSADFNADVMKLSNAHIVSFDIGSIDSSYSLLNENLLEECFSFMSEIIYQPLFDSRLFGEEKRLHIEYIKGLYSNKMKYAIKEHRDIMFEGETYRLDPLGTEETITNVTLEDIKQAYQTMIQEDRLVVTIVGNVTEEDITPLIHTYLRPTKDAKLPVLKSTSHKQIQTVKTAEKVMDVKQAKLVIGYRLDVLFGEEDYYKALLFNLVFGGSSESMLFDEIRENSGLVYFINSTYSAYKGALFVYSGINQNDYQTVLDKVEDIIQKMQSGDIPVEILEMAKKTYINGLIQSTDSIYSLSSKMFHSYLFDYDLNIQKSIEEVSSITITDISKIASRLQKDTVFLLRGEQDE